MVTPTLADGASGGDTVFTAVDSGGVITVVAEVGNGPGRVDVEVRTPDHLSWEISGTRALNISGMASGGNSAVTADSTIALTQLGRDLNVGTSTGDIMLRVPVDTNATIDAATAQGEVIFYGIEFTGTTATGAASGQLNDGGGRHIDLGTASGDIKVEGTGFAESDSGTPDTESDPPDTESDPPDTESDPPDTESGAPTCASEICVPACTTGGCETCVTRSTCDSHCTGGTCDMTCAGDANCTFTCSGGNCVMGCYDASNCTMSCPPGNCDMTCDTTSSCQTF